MLTLLLNVINGCEKKETKFDKSQWLIMGDIGSFPCREHMLEDSVKHHQLQGLTYNQLLALLGEPSNYGESDGTIRHLIIEDFASDIDPVHGKTLDLTLGPDSITTSYKVSVW
ncbi:hypothetical protein [Hymenobacter ruricola]|uniref:Uncharacterized protein n=1 Tax=Hymenobacter ruricola TaxID=2791023 RepID=A0ABS0IBF6_9BACT|nr:hypothetical protein [Hymenobacter ruricola]MBF9224257.1 hypothetical protein [Hymenobacter ruricola]